MIVARMSACRSACQRNNFGKSRVSDVSARLLARMSVSVSWNAGFTSPHKPRPYFTRCCCCATEAVYRLRDQRAAVVPLHAEEPKLVQVPRLAPRRLVAVRVLHNGHDRHEHHHPHDEGTPTAPGQAVLTANSHRPTPLKPTAELRRVGRTGQNCFAILGRRILFTHCLTFLPARRYASAGISCRRASVCLSVCVSVTLPLCIKIAA